MPRPIKTDRNREVARSWVDGDTLEVIARRHGVTRQCVQQILRLPVAVDIVRPDEFVSVPTWVENADLRDDFIDVASAHDEYATRSPLPRPEARDGGVGMTLSLFFDLILGGAAVSIGWHLARGGLARFWPSLLPRAVESIWLVIETDAGCQCPDCTAEREEVVRVH